jgi:hypothetical protein
MQKINKTVETSGILDKIAVNRLKHRKGIPIMKASSDSHEHRHASY